MSAQLRLTVGESTPDFPTVPRPRTGAPNVVVILFDDLGFGQFGCFGSDIDTPNIDRLAAGGLRYNRFHVTALCSPTRASLLTGRNHHAVGMGFLCDMPLAFPGYNGRVPKSAVPLPRVMRDAGYSTMAVGKWHLVPAGERTPAGPFDRWPLGFGFERYYGFLRGDANHWSPQLACDNHLLDQPATPHDGYHLTEDLTDQAIRYIQEQKQSAPDKPFFLYYALGAMHAPHHVDRSWIDKFAGRYDDGWEAFRERAFARQLEMGVVPEGTTLTERPPWVQAWRDLSPAARRVFARMQEGFAGFLTHTDAQIGRLLDHLERMGQLDNTIVLLMSDNGASAEGGLLGTANEHRFTQHMTETIEGLTEHLDDWGGKRAYHHYAWGWAWAGNTPFRLWKRYTWLGGTRTPLVVHWPAGIAAQGEVRQAFCHAVDLAPTVLDICGIDPPQSVDGVSQQRLDGASLAATFADADAPGRSSQYFEMLGSRSIYLDGWKATTDHVSQGVADEERMLEGSRSFASDHWSLFALDNDFSEAHDVSGQHPEVLRRLQQQWLVEAGANNVLPMDDTLVNRFGTIVPPPYPPGQHRVFVPGAPVSDEAIPRFMFGVDLTAVVDVPAGDADGVLFALGDWTNGIAMYARSGRVTAAVNAGGEVTRATTDAPLAPGRHEVTCVLRPGMGSASIAVVIDGSEAAKAESPYPLPHAWQHGGTALLLGHDRGFPVTDDYACPFPWTGEIVELRVDAPAPPNLLDIRATMEAALHAD
ncbi:MAG: arylsulfatase [Acidimicrobiia bacterium]